MSEHRTRVEITISTAARRSGLSTHLVRRCIREGLVNDAIDEAELARLRRIRRLHELGVNLYGIGIILRMRRRIEELQAELARREAGGKRS
jgi:DNA-binding transcriptional MerR regulator